MSLIFHVRGDNLNARYSRAGKTPGFHQSQNTVPDPVVTADAGAGIFGGSVISLAHATQQRAILWPGGRNWTENPSFSLLARFVPRFSGIPSVNQGLIYIGEPHGNYREGLYLVWNQTTGSFGIHMRDKFGTNLHSANTAGVLTTAVSGTPFDFFISWDGTTNAGALKISIEGVEFETRTAGAGLAALRDLNRIACVMAGFGIGSSSGISNLDLNELAIWDSVEPHVYAPRTGFLTSDSFDGASYSVPVAGDIKHGVAAINAGVALTGTYRGADLWETVPTDKVDTGFQYLADGATLTGNSNDPTEADVRAGVSYDNGSKVGTLAVPAEEDVREGVSVDAGVGGLIVPAATDVREGVAFDDGITEGSLAVPAAADVKIGVEFDNASVGSYTGADRWSDPGVANVRSGVAYIANSESKTGTLQLVTNEIEEAEITTSGGQPIGVTQGDNCNLQLVASTGAGLHDLTGAVFETKVRGSDEVLTIADGQHTADADQVANKGKFTIALQTAVSSELARGATPFVVKVTQGTAIMHFHGILQVKGDDPREN
jgi:hypothetical protein